MKVNEIINEDLSRRGFLKGLGAAAVVGSGLGGLGGGAKNAHAGQRSGIKWNDDPYSPLSYGIGYLWGSLSQFKNKIDPQTTEYIVRVNDLWKKDGSQGADAYNNGYGNARASGYNPSEMNHYISKLRQATNSIDLSKYSSTDNVPAPANFDTPRSQYPMTDQQRKAWKDLDNDPKTKQTIRMMRALGY
jgi:hypothetical protein